MSPKKASRQESEETNMQQTTVYAALTHYTTVLRDAVCYNHSRAFFEHRSSCADVAMTSVHGTTHGIPQIVYVNRCSIKTNLLLWQPLFNS